MFRLLISLAFVLALAMSAEAMSPVPLYQPDRMIKQVHQPRHARQACDDPNEVRINGVCEFWARHVSRAQQTCVEENEGFCVEYYGTLAPCGPEVRC